MPDVYVASCSEYDPEAIAAHVRAAAQALGVALPTSGSAIIHAAIPFAHPRFAADAWTHSEALEGVARTMSGTKLAIGGQSLPGFPTRFSLGHAGFRGAASRLKARLVAFDERAFRAVAGLPQTTEGKPLEIASDWLDSSFRVSMPRLMGSTFMPFTGALLQFLPLLPQQTQMAVHHQLPEVLFPVVAAARPNLIVVDAIKATHKGGEISGEAVDLNLLIIGKDPVAVDLICAVAYGVPAAEMAFLADANPNGPSSAEQVSLAGDVDLAELRRRAAAVSRMDPDPEDYPLPKKVSVVRSDKSRLVSSAGSLTEALAVVQKAGWDYSKSRQVALVLGAVDDIPKGTTDKSTVVFIGDTARGETEGYNRVVRLLGRNVAVSQILMDLPFLLDIGNSRSDLGMGLSLARIRARLARMLGGSGGGGKAAAGPPRAEGGGGPAAH
jgi:uncharacterized protein (DUF362 family)